MVLSNFKILGLHSEVTYYKWKLLQGLAVQAPCFSLPSSFWFLILSNRNS